MWVVSGLFPTHQEAYRLRVFQIQPVVLWQAFFPPHLRVVSHRY